MTTQSFAERANDPQASTEAAEPAPSTPNTGDQPFLVVGDRAFATPDDAKTKISNQDTHISTIESENAQLREELNKAIEELKAAKTLDEALQGSNKKTLTLEQIEEASNTVYQRNKQNEKRLENRRACNIAAEKSYGENFIDNIISTAKELNMEMSAVDNLAETQPEVFKRLFIKEATTSTPPPSSHTSEINTATLQETPSSDDVKPVLSLTSKQRQAQFLKQLESINNQ